MAHFLFFICKCHKLF